MQSRYALALVAAAAFMFPSQGLAGSQTHSVVKGDTLWTLSQRFHVRLTTLEGANHLSDASILQLGQILMIPMAPPSAPARHVGFRGRAPTRGVGAKRLSAHRAANPEAAAAQTLWAAAHAPRLGSVPARIATFDARILRTAMRFLGAPYAFGGTGYGGFDCSGFVYSVFLVNGIHLPRMADEQYYAARPVSWRNMRPGDLVFFETYAPGASHVGIYIGAGRFIHASTSAGVRIDSLGMSYYASRYLGARRLI